MTQRAAHASAQAEDYLERIHELVEVKGYARVSDIAAALNLTRPSVSAMVRRLSKAGFLNYENYRGLSLTDKGRNLAGVIRERHEILKEFIELLGVNPEVVSQDVEGIEHCISDESLEKVAQLCRFWRHDPAKLRQALDFKG